MNVPILNLPNEPIEQLKRVMAQLKLPESAPDVNIDALLLPPTDAIVKKLRGNQSISLRELWKLLEDDAWWENNPTIRVDVLKSLFKTTHASTAEARMVRAACEQPSIVLAKWLATTGWRTILSPDWTSLITALKEPLQFARYSAKKLLSPEQVLAEHGLLIPAKAKAAQQCIGEAFLLERVEGTHAKQVEGWLIVQLEQMDNNDAITQLLILIKKLSADESTLYAKLREFLIKMLSDESKLNPAMKEIIQKWKNSEKFAQLENNIRNWIIKHTSKTPEAILSIPKEQQSGVESQARQMWRRLLFLSNYTTSFPNIKYSSVKHHGSQTILIEMTNNQVNMSTYLHGDISFIINQDKINLGKNGWQKKAYDKLCALGIHPNSGLVKFRGIPDYYLDKKGMPK